MARYPFSLDDFPRSEYAAELRKPATTLPFPPAMEQHCLDDHLRRMQPRITARTAVAMLRSRTVAFEEPMQRVCQQPLRGPKTALSS